MMTDPFLQRIVFKQDRGEFIDGHLRYMYIRADALMGFIKALPKDLHSLAFKALSESIAHHGHDSAKFYMQQFEGGSESGLLEIIANTAPQLGWGIWRFADVSDNGMRLHVFNSPFVHGFGELSEQPVCAAITGMLQGISRIIYNAPVTVTETRCMANELSPDACCHFSVVKS